MTNGFERTSSGAWPSPPEVAATRCGPELLGEAARVARQVHDDQLLRLVLSASAEVNVWLAKYDTAREHYEESIRLATLIGDHTGRAVILAELGWLEYLTGDYRQADKWATEAMELAEALQHTRTLISALRVLGEVASGLGEADDGRRFVGARSKKPARSGALPSSVEPCARWPASTSTSSRSTKQKRLPWRLWRSKHWRTR